MMIAQWYRNGFGLRRASASLTLAALVPLLAAAASVDDSDLTMEAMVDQLAVPDTVNGLKIENGTRGFGVKSAQRLTLQSVTFKFDSAELTAAAEVILARVGEALRHPRLSGAQFQVVGHTDARGSETYNQVLSEKRARSVAIYLEKAGVGPTRLDVVGMGEGALLDSERPDSMDNRRVEIVKRP